MIILKLWLKYNVRHIASAIFDKAIDTNAKAGI